MPFWMELIALSSVALCILALPQTRKSRVRVRRNNRPEEGR